MNTIELLDKLPEEIYYKYINHLVKSAYGYKFIKKEEYEQSRTSVGDF